MKEVNEIMFEDALQFLYENLGQIFSAAEVILLWLLGRKIKKSDKSTSFFQSAVTISDPAPATSPAPKTVKKQLSAQLLSDLELLFSDKDDADLTEDEKTRISALTSYLLEVKK